MGQVENLSSIVAQAQAGSLDAFGVLVRQFQGLAVAYACSILHDSHLAEDAAQEAFIDAYRRLLDLREPAAFPGWLRRIVFKHCDRLTRRRRVTTVPLEAASSVATGDPSPAEAVAQREMQARVLDAIKALPERQNVAVKLFYVDGRSQKEVAEFMDVPVGTVKARLHEARKRLRARMLYLDEED